jgi:replicative DNA helicase
MGATQVMQRLIASRSYVSNDKIQTGWLNANDKVKIVSAIDEISHTEIFFDDTPNAKLGDVIAKATRLKNTHPNLGLIVIDYLGRIRYSDKADLSARQMEVSYVSGALKTLARTLDVPVICLAQLNRNVESSESKVPALSNLRESGSIEQDADIVMLMYRKDYYRDLGQQTKEKGWAKDKKGGDQPQTQLAQPTTEDSTDNTGGMSDVKVLVAKNRNGQTGQVTLLFQKAFSRFDDPSPEYEEAEARAAAEGGE